MTLRASAIAAVLVAALGFASLWAQQAASGRIYGTVKDQTGGAVVGASVTVIDLASGLTLSMTSDKFGVFSAPNLPSSTYALRATFAGFEAYERTGITLQAGADLSTAVVLQPGMCSGGCNYSVADEVPVISPGIRGIVRDPRGAPIAGATVTVTNVASGVVGTLTTNKSGAYIVGSLVFPGTYAVRVTATGFQSWERTSSLIGMGGDMLDIDPILQDGSQTHTVTMSSGPLPRPLRIFCSTAVHTPVEEMKAQLERAAGRPVTIDWDSSQRLGAQIDAGEAFDIAVLSTEGMDTYVKKGAITAASRAYLGRTGAAMAVRKGAPKPDISTREKLKQVLLNAKSIAMNPTGASGVHFNRLIEEMGIAEQIKPKMVLSAEPGSQPKNVADGKAEMIWTQSTEIAPYPGIEMIGPLPADVQSYSTFDIGVGAKSSDAAAAGAVVKFLTSDAAKATFRARFVEVR